MRVGIKNGRFFAASAIVCERVMPLLLVQGTLTSPHLRLVFLAAHHIVAQATRETFLACLYTNAFSSAQPPLSFISGYTTSSTASASSTPAPPASARLPCRCPPRRRACGTHLRGRRRLLLLLAEGAAPAPPRSEALGEEGAPHAREGGGATSAGSGSSRAARTMTTESGVGMSWFC